MEIWKDIKGYENKYQVSSYGRIKIKENRTKRMNMGELRDYVQKEKLLKPQDNGFGYLQITLYSKDNKKRYYVHRLVAMAFINNYNNYEQVNHIDGNTKNNNVNNLEWVNRSMNMRHAIDVLGFESNRSGINKEQPVYKIDIESGKVLQEYKTISEAQKKTGISHISCVCRGKRKSAGGYFWKYKNDC